MIRIKQCSLADLDALLNLQKRCFAALKNKDWLRNNSEENFRVCLQTPNFALGLFSEEQLIAIAILQICGLDSENLGYQLELSDEQLEKTGNMKLVLIDPAYRKRGWQYRLMQACEEYARQYGLNRLAVTVHPDNSVSVHNIEKSGYVYHSQQSKYGGLNRSLYYKKLK